jgi:flagellar secretion chaperone FliS
VIGAQSIAHKYQATQVGTADRGRLLLLMFDGGLKFLGQARTALEAGDRMRFAQQLGRAQAVILELLQTLDHKAGGEIAANLDRLYRFMLDHLTEANQQKSVRHLDQVSRLLGTIADAYRTILARGVPVVDAA